MGTTLKPLVVTEVVTIITLCLSGDYLLWQLFMFQSNICNHVSIFSEETNIVITSVTDESGEMVFEYDLKEVTSESFMAAVMMESFTVSSGETVEQVTIMEDAEVVRDVNIYSLHLSQSVQESDVMMIEESFKEEYIAQHACEWLTAA